MTRDEGRNMLTQPLKFEDLTIGDTLYLQRRLLKASQSEVASAAGVSRNYISLLERGQTENLTIGTMNKICYALGLDVDIVFRLKEKTEPPEKCTCPENWVGHQIGCKRGIQLCIEQSKRW